jgi:enhancing lycopene biosynthesis protein 2
VHFDPRNGVLTSPAYMAARSIGEAARSIDALVSAVLARVPARSRALR